ncbi:MAG TPA: sulfotransferase, partial [Planctomycetaceae bacterium]
MGTTSADRLDRAFRVPLSSHLFGGAVHGFRRFWVRLGNLESRVLTDRLQGIPIDRPIFIAGLARSGTTILLEALARHPRVVTHRYRDFPPVFTPYWWQEVLRRGPRVSSELVERAHGDGLPVGPDSPEAMEEPIWMAFFPEIHTPGRCQVLDDRTDNPAFERFYRDHLRKLLLARGGERYLSKGNYNVSRLRYLLKLFPDARVVIPVRHPRGHVA